MVEKEVLSHWLRVSCPVSVGVAGAGCVAVLISSHSLSAQVVLVVLPHPNSAASSPANTVPVAS